MKNRRGLTPTKTKVIYREQYYAREVHVIQAEARSILETADYIYAVEQGEIEIPSFDNQRRIVCVMRFERIVRDEKPAQSTVAVDRQNLDS